MTRLLRFRGEHLRCVARVELAETAELNLLVGANGAGKTSVLEGIHLLGTGRSFRSRHAGDVIQSGAAFLRVAGEVDDGAGHVSRLGVERGTDRVELRSAGRKVQQTSALARVLPLLVIRPESFELFAGGSEERRRALDWAVFHVEHGFGEAHGRYHRALRQRNAGLRHGAPVADLVAWDQDLGQAGLQVDGARRRFLGGATAALDELIQELTGLAIRLEFRRGWAQDSDLDVALRDGLASDRERGTTQRGPHRADLRFRLAGEDARARLSRGEGKRLVQALLLGLAAQVGSAAAHRPVLLLDDLASELDASARAVFLDRVRSVGCQAFVTLVEKRLVADRHLADAAVFHVEQGQVSRVL